MTRLTFEERNQNNYVKHSDVSIETINKYKGKLPDELLNIWNIMGYGIYENGFMQLVNPDEYEFVFEYIDKLLEPSIVSVSYTHLDVYKRQLIVPLQYMVL